MAFHRRLQEVLSAIPEDGMSAEDFYFCLRPFVAAVGDAHTSIREPFQPNWGKPGGIPLWFNVIEKSLYVERVCRQEYMDFIGYKLVSVEGVPLSELLERRCRVVGAENDISLLARLGRFETLYRGDLLSRLLPEWKNSGSVHLVLETAEGERSTHELPTGARVDYPLLGKQSRFDKLPSIERSDFVYSFLDDAKHTAMLRIDGMMTYREAYEAWVSVGAPRREQDAKRLYKRFNGADPPDAYEDVIAGLPSATELFRQLVRDMKDAGTKRLYVDLRRNNGGASFMGDILLYFLYGAEKIVDIKYMRPSSEIKKYSEYFFDHNDVDFEELAADFSFPLLRDDYDFRLDGIHGGGWTPERAHARLRETVGWMPTFSAEYDSGEYSGYYCPKQVVVLVSPSTFSSGFTMMLRLWQAGAILVGRPSTQAGNHFGDTVSFELEHSKIQGSVSRKAYTYFPEEPFTGHVLHPQHELTLDVLADYDFDPNVEILWAEETLPDP
jgi:hypothetical protein